MKLPANTKVVTHYIWQPRYRDKTVLIAKRALGEHNLIRFTDAPSLGKDSYYLHLDTIKKYETESMNTKQRSKILVHPVPLDELVLFEGYAASV